MQKVVGITSLALQIRTVLVMNTAVSDSAQQGATFVSEVIVVFTGRTLVLVHEQGIGVLNLDSLNLVAIIEHSGFRGTRVSIVHLTFCTANVWLGEVISRRTLGAILVLIVPNAFGFFFSSRQTDALASIEIFQRLFTAHFIRNQLVITRLALITDYGRVVEGLAFPQRVYGFAGSVKILGTAATK